MVFIFLHFNCQEKYFFKFLLASMKTLTNSGDFTGRPRQNFQLWRHLKENWKPQFSQSSACDFEKKYRNPLQKFLNLSPSSPAYGTIYRITGVFLNAATSILKRVSVRIFKISKCIHRSKQKLEFPFSP